MEPLGLSNALYGIQQHLGAHASERNAQSSPEPIVVPEDRVSISAAAKAQSQLTAEGGETPIAPEEGETPVSPQDVYSPAHAGAADVDEESLTTAEQRLVEELRARDREVRAHERAHLAAAGGFAQGGPSYTYQVGPDGRRYAVGGEVPIDISEVPGNPRATIQKAMTIRRAALAPAQPSGADRAVAARATHMVLEAQQDVLRESQEGRAQDTSEVHHTHAPGTTCAACRAQQSDTLTALAPEETGQVADGSDASFATPSVVRAPLTLTTALQRYQSTPDTLLFLATA